MSVRRLLHNAFVSVVLFVLVLTLIQAPLPASERFETYVAFVLTEDLDAELLSQGMRNLGSFTARWAWLDWLQRLARSLTGAGEEAVPAGGTPELPAARE